MVHAIEFCRVVAAAVDRPEYAKQQRVVVKEGTQLHAHLKPYVVESPDGPVELADLHLDDGSVVRAVRFAASGSWTVPKAVKRKSPYES